LFQLLLIFKELKMKKILTISLMLLAYAYASAQQPQQQQAQQQPPQPTQQQQRPQGPIPGQVLKTLDPNRMSPGMTEIMDPEVPIITPGVKDSNPPSDAIILFDGSDVNKEWCDNKGNPTKWIAKDGELVCVPRSGVIQTKRKFGSVQLHIEWKAPSEVKGDGQGRGNSGVYMQELYEIQVLDSYNNRTYRNGQAGALYKQYAPLANASRKPGEWQTYDIIYTAPTFGRDTTVYNTPPRITVIHNGVLIQNNVILRGPTEYIGIPEYFVKVHGPASLVLQDHGNPVAFRNIWIREL
jgi:hypothetical protein